MLKRADLHHEQALRAALLETALALEAGRLPGGSLGGEVGIAALPGGSAACPGDALVAAPDTGEIPGAAPGSALEETAAETALTGAVPRTALPAGIAPAALTGASPVRSAD